MPRARPLTKRQWQIIERVMTDHARSLAEEIEEMAADLEEGRVSGEWWQRTAIEVGHQLEADQAILSKVRERT